MIGKIEGLLAAAFEADAESKFDTSAASVRFKVVFQPSPSYPKVNASQTPERGIFVQFVELNSL